MGGKKETDDALAQRRQGRWIDENSEGRVTIVKVGETLSLIRPSLVVLEYYCCCCCCSFLFSEDKKLRGGLVVVSLIILHSVPDGTPNPWLVHVRSWLLKSVRVVVVFLWTSFCWSLIKIVLFFFSCFRVCDSEPDCPDESDENPSECPHLNVNCSPDKFLCHNLECIPGHLHCSGVAECSDGSDEENCGKICL